LNLGSRWFFHPAPLPAPLTDDAVVPYLHRCAPHLRWPALPPGRAPIPAHDTGLQEGITPGRVGHITHHVHDGALTGRHNQELLRDLGIVLINRPRAARREKAGGRVIRRVPRGAITDSLDLRRPDGGHGRLDLYQRDGAYGVGALDSEGRTLFIPLAVERVHAYENRNGTFRFYVDVQLTPEDAERYGRAVVTLPVYTTKKDEAKEFKRAANVRAIPPGSPGFWIYEQLRADSESFNRSIEDSLYRHERAHSVGWRRQWIDLLGLSVLTNALTLARFRKQKQDQAA
jgi:hypothetical protein